MPMINVKLAADPDDALAREAAKIATTLTAELLGKDPAVTSVAVDFYPRRHWFMAGKSAEQHGRAAFYVNVSVTEGTNTKDEKARYLAAVFAAFDRLLGGAHPESYIYVVEARGDAYGYGGLTQERRYVEGRPAR